VQGISLLRRRAGGRIQALLLFILPCLLAGCGADDGNAQIGAQRWGNLDVAVEVRPSPPRAGHNEVVVIVSGEHHRPIYDALVYLRAQPDLPWVQAIEDGHVGVYRRAVLFADGGAAALQVRLQRGSEESVLIFPLSLRAAR